MCLSLKVSTNAMCNSVWKCVLFMDMKSKAHGICINWIYVSHLRFFKIFIFIFQTRLLSNLNLSIITYSFSGSIHVQRTGSSCCPIFFRVSWLYDPLSYPSCGLKAFVSLTIWYFDKLATKKKIDNPVIFSSFFDILVAFPLTDSKVLLNILQTLKITENASTKS